jgi:hypothetical protein
MRTDGRTDRCGGADSMDTFHCDRASKVIFVPFSSFNGGVTETLIAFSCVTSICTVC